MAFYIKTLRADDTSKIAPVLGRYGTEQDDFDRANHAQFGAIEGAIAATQDLGRLPLWDKYKDVPNYSRKPMGDKPARSMNDVRTKEQFCRFYAWLAYTLAPDAILEIGAAFGASGMYWLAGLKAAKTGILYGFEPNDVWHPIAQRNFDLVSDRHLLTLGTYEENAKVVTKEPGIVLIDAIHTRDFVMNQLELVREEAAPRTLVLFDDINFSDDMKACWADLANDPDWRGVWQLGSRVGMVELP